MEPNSVRVMSQHDWIMIYIFKQNLPDMEMVDVYDCAYEGIFSTPVTIKKR